jgi:hypothetical protein
VAHDAVAGGVVRREDHLVQRHATRVLHLDRVADRVPEQALKAPAHQVHQLVSHVGCGKAPVLAGIVNCPPCRGTVHCGDPAGELGDSIRVVLAKAARQHRGREEHPELDLVGRSALEPGQLHQRGPMDLGCVLVDEDEGWR